MFKLVPRISKNLRGYVLDIYTRYIFMKISGLNNQKRFTPDTRLEDNQRLSMYELEAI